MKDKKKVLIPIIAVLVLILGVLGFYFYNSKTSSKNIFKTAINETFESITKSLKGTNEDSSVDFDMSLNIQTSNQEIKQIASLINDLKVSGSAKVSEKNKIVDMDLNTKYQEKDLLSMNLYTDNENLYIYLKDLFDKYIEVPIKTTESSIDNQDMIDLLNSLKTSLNKSLKDEYFSETKENGIIKSTLKLDEKVTEEILTNLTKELSNNSKFIEAFAKISGEDKETIKNLLNETNDLKIDPYTAEISIYTKGTFREFTKIEFITDGLIMKIDREDTKYSFSINAGMELLSGYIIANEKDNQENYEIQINIPMVDIKVNIKLNQKINKNVKVDKKNITSKVIANEISETDYYNILKNLQKNQTLLDLIGSME